MSDAKMHEDELDIDEPLVRRLLEAQFPAWKDLPVRRVRSSGTVNAIFRLGEDMAVRLALLPGGWMDVEKEHTWLPKLAPRLPIAVPEILAYGEPTSEYPLRWSICRWLDGENPTAANLGDQLALAADLAAFATAFWRIDVPGGPPAYRGGPLPGEASEVREAIAELRTAKERGIDLGMDVDIPAVTAAWDESLAAPAWTAPGVWLHSDLLPGNLLVAHGRLSGVLDFGTVGVGDPASDTMPAWTLFDAPAREVYRARLGVDDATWIRGRGWALVMAVVALPYYVETNPAFAEMSRRTITAVLADRASGRTTG